MNSDPYGWQIPMLPQCNDKEGDRFSNLLFEILLHVIM
jgi:hypothetical protein